MADMTEAMVRNILRTGLRHDVWESAGEGQTPDNVPLEEAQKAAALLVQLARQSYDKGVTSETVLDLLFDAQVEPTKPGEFDDVYAKHGQSPPPVASGQAAPPAETPPTASDAFAAAAAASGEVDINSIYPGYDDQKAKDIVTAIKAGAASGELVPDELEQIKAYERDHEERKSILELEVEFKAPEPEPAPAPAPAAAAKDTEGNYGSADDLKDAYEGGSLGTDRVRQERLPIPAEFQGNEAEIVLPVDITSISHEQLSRLAMAYSSLEARTLWLVSQEEGRAEACTSLRQDSHRAAFSHEFERIKSGLERQTGTALEAARSEANKLADDEKSVVVWRNRERRHSIEAKSLQALLAGYERTTARLSREQTRREKLAGNGS